MTISESPLALGETPIFQGLSQDEAASLADRVQLKRYPLGVDLIRAGHASPGLYVIRSGLVAAVVPDASGVEREVSTLGKGECVGEMSLMTGEPCSTSVRTIVETEAWLLEPADFADIMERFPGLWRNLGRILSQRLVRTSRRLAVRPYANTIALVMDCPDEEAVALALATAASVARQTGKRTLLVDGRRSSPCPLTGLAPVSASPSFSAMLHNQALVKEHEGQPAPGDGLCGARIAMLEENGEAELAPDEMIAVLAWLRPLYDHVIILTRPDPGEMRQALFEHGRSISALVCGDTLRAVPSWLDELARLPAAREKLDVSITTGGLSDTAVIQAIEDVTGRPARRLPISGDAIRKLLSSKDLFPGDQDDSFRTGVDRLARQIGEMEVGLALGAGAAKGFAHIGVLRVLGDCRVPIDYIVGTSIGAIIAAGYACGLSLKEIEGFLQGADRKLARWTLPFRSIWSDGGLIKMLRAPIPVTRFRDLPIPFAAVATDIATGREAILRRGLVWRAVQASATVPGIFPPPTIRGRQLVDGGLVNPVPGQAVRDLGADIVIAVDLMSPSARSHANPPAPARRGGAMRWTTCARSRAISSRCRSATRRRTGR